TPCSRRHARFEPPAKTGAVPPVRRQAPQRMSGGRGGRQILGDDVTRMAGALHRRLALIAELGAARSVSTADSAWKRKPLRGLRSERGAHASFDAWYSNAPC